MSTSPIARHYPWIITRLSSHESRQIIKVNAYIESSLASVSPIRLMPNGEAPLTEEICGWR